MKLIFIDEGLDPGQFGDLMDQRRGVIAEQSLTTAPAVGRLTSDGFTDFLGWDQNPLGPTMLGLTAAFLAGGSGGRLSLGPDEIGRGRLVRVGGVELESCLEVVDSGLEFASPLLHRQNHCRNGRLSIRRHLVPEFLGDGQWIGHSKGIVPSSATFNTGP